MAELTTLEFMEIARRMAATRTTDERERGLLDDFLADLEREITNVRGYPRNRWRITLRVEAATFERASRELENIAAHVTEHDPLCGSVGGGEASHIVDVSELPEITPESYSVDLATWREKRRP